VFMTVSAPLVMQGACEHPGLCCDTLQGCEARTQLVCVSRASLAGRGLPR
jgi:hypothetical protein